MKGSRKGNSIKEILSAMPTGISAMFLFFLALPIWSALFLRFPWWQNYQSYSLWVILADVLTLWALPLAVAFCIYFRSWVTIPVYIAQCLALILYSFTYLPQQGMFFEVFRGGLIASVAIGGLFLITRDNLLPLLSGESRLWRLNRRLRVERPVRLNIPHRDNTINAVIKDCSYTGLCLKGFQEELAPLLERLKTHHAVRVHFQVNGRVYLLKCRLAWAKQQEELLFLGLNVGRKDALARLVHQLCDKAFALAPDQLLVRYLLRSQYSRAIALCWSLSMILSVGLPSCSNDRDLLNDERVAMSQVSSDEATIDINFNMGLGLTGTLENAQMEVSGCQSGYFKDFPWISSGQVRLVTDDAGCRVSVSEFSMDNQIFRIRQGEVFQTEIGGKTPFESDSGDLIYIFVIRQLSDSIQPGNEAVEFALIQVEQGSQISINGPALATVSSSVSTTQVTEGNSTVTFTITRSAPIDYDLLVNYAFEGTASLNTDYTGTAGSYVIPAGSDRFTVSVTVQQDTAVEYDESVILRVLDGPAYVPSATHSGFIIIDNDAAFPSRGRFVWYDRNGISQNKNIVSQWTDDETPAENATQTNTSLRPAFARRAMNNLNAVNFAGTGYLDLPSVASMDTGGPYSQRTVAIAFQTGSNVNSAQVLWEQGDRDRGMNITIRGGRVYLGAWNKINESDGSAAWGPVFISRPVAASTIYLVKFVLDSDQQTLTGYLNGITMGQQFGVGKVYASTNGSGLGGVRGETILDNGTVATTNYFGGMIGEVLMYNVALTEAEHRGIDDTVMSRFAIPLTPKLGLFALTSSVPETTGDYAVFRVSRGIPQAVPVTVSLTIGGTAVQGSDYGTLPITATIPAFATHTDIMIRTMDDPEVEGTETISMSLITHPSYDTDTSLQTVSIMDND